MALTRIRQDDLEHPLLFIQRDTFSVWRGAVDIPAETKGLLVDREGRAYRVIGAEERRRFTDWGTTLICDGDPVILSLEEVRRRIAWIASAAGHFESPKGFGLPPGVTTANSIAELFEALSATELR